MSFSILASLGSLAVLEMDSGNIDLPQAVAQTYSPKFALLTLLPQSGNLSITTKSEEIGYLPAIPS